MRAARRAEARLSRGRLKRLTAIADHLIALSKPSFLYRELCRGIARTAGTAAIVIRLAESEELPQILACHIGGGDDVSYRCRMIALLGEDSHGGLHHCRTLGVLLLSCSFGTSIAHGTREE